PKSVAKAKVKAMANAGGKATPAVKAGGGGVKPGSKPREMLPKAAAGTKPKPGVIPAQSGKGEGLGPGQKAPTTQGHDGGEGKRKLPAEWKEGIRGRGGRTDSRRGRGRGGPPASHLTREREHNSGWVGSHSASSRDPQGRDGDRDRPSGRGRGP
ncbi:unnamed protein product, partial [Discosporangium mesarthrocarpum]